MGFNCNEFSIKLVKIAEEVDLATWLVAAAPAKGHVRSTYRSSRVNASCDLANSRDDPQDNLTIGILSVIFIPFTHTTYTLITHKIVSRLFRRKP